MKRILLIASVASLMGAAGIASAQTSIPATEPGVAGQASTQTPAGVPNPPERTNQANRASVRSEATMQNKNTANSNTPAGETTTTRNHQPNATERVSQQTRAEVRQDARPPKPRFGEKGERPDVPTNPKNATGTPQ